MPTDLWIKVLNYEFDQPLSSYGFSVRLANENFWTRNFTQKAILEYKKFMYLAATSEFMVSPSPIIDKVWHEHLMFSKSYQNLCNLLGKNIQHVPSTNNPDEYEKFKNAKDRTQKLYKNAFGEAPEDIWNYESMYASLNLPKARIKIRSFIIIGLLVSAALLFPAYHLLRPFYLRIDNPDFLFGYVSLIIICVGILELWNRKRLQHIMFTAHPNSFLFELHPLEVVYLCTQKHYKAINGPVNKLIVEKKIWIGNNQRLHATKMSRPGNLEEYEIFLAFERYGGSNYYPALLSLLTKAAVFANISSSMDALKKYVLKSKPFAIVFYITFTVLAVLLMAGMMRLAVGIVHGRPVGFIGPAMIAVSVVFALYLYRLSRMICTTIIPSYYRETPGNVPESLDSYWQYMLIGSAALTPVFQPLDSYVQRNSQWTDGSTCGTSCSSSGGSGSSCGSSCSSCGGCGGD